MLGLVRQHIFGSAFQYTILPLLLRHKYFGPPCWSIQSLSTFNRVFIDIQLKFYGRHLSQRCLAFGHTPYNTIWVVEAKMELTSVPGLEKGGEDGLKCSPARIKKMRIALR